ncbi:MAG TPA: protein jag [Clostridiales bacterium]|jgi:spoIIIJ-associated protein|nr:protein jag [Clostridiales bacterium]
MNKYIDVEGQAKNINDALADAIQKATAELGLPRESVTYELLEKGKTGFFGLGGVTAKVRVYYEVGVSQKAEDFLSDLFRLMHLDAKINLKETTESLDITLEGNEMGILIGRRGETLDALQYLTGLVVNRGEERHVRVNLDTENYREKRMESLERLAKKTAEKAIIYKKNISLEPMSPQERRVIHTVLQNYPGISTHSVGKDPKRRVIVVNQNSQRANEARKESKVEQSGGSQAPKPASRNNQRRRRPRPKSQNTQVKTEEA